ncbi:MAG: hypothetical protein K2O88_06105 [Paramuribaculum sp.]|nr:hypothetical protein [Paramuribaculum sp.]
MNRILILPVVFILFTTVACGSGTQKNKDAAMEDVVVEKRDSAVYMLGRSHARRMLEQCTTTDMLRNELLDIRARESLIRSRMYPEAGQAYIQGFRHYLQESGDTLAVTLFGE